MADPILGIILAYFNPAELAFQEGIELYYLNLVKDTQPYVGELSDRASLIFTQAGLIGEQTVVPNSTQCLKVACKSHQLQAFQLLLRQHPKQNLQHLLNYAIRHQCPPVIQYLRTHHKVQFDPTKSYTYTFLMACTLGLVDMVEIFLEVGGDNMVRNDRAMMNAVRGNHLEIVQILHEAGADITVPNNLPLVQASRNGHVEMVKFLLENGADLTANHNYAMCEACSHDHMDVLKILMAAKEKK